MTQFATKDGAPLNIRWMLRRDLEAVEDIEKLSFSNPLNGDELLAILRKVHCIGMIAEMPDGLLVGHIMYEIKPRKVRLCTLAVHPEFRRRQIGQCMLERIRWSFRKQRRELISIDVRESNLPAQLFFRSQRFGAVNILKSHFHDTKEDAYRMEHIIEDELI